MTNPKDTPSPQPPDGFASWLHFAVERSTRAGHGSIVCSPMLKEHHRLIVTPFARPPEPSSVASPLRVAPCDDLVYSALDPMRRASAALSRMERRPGDRGEAVLDDSLEASNST